MFGRDENYKLSFYSHKAKAPIQIQEVFNIEFTGEVNVFASDLGRAFINIFDNAFYTLKNKKLRAGNGFVPQIDLSIKEEGQNFTVTIRDNGEGIPKTKIDQVIDPFFTTKKVGEGTGLGMSISKRIVESHQGKLGYELKNGHTSFYIELQKETETSIEAS